MSSSVTHFTQMAKVISPDGKVKEFIEPIRAEEILVQYPGHFICHSDCVDVGKFMAPLDAEAELELGEVYFVLPLRKLQFAVSMSDMAAMLFAANSAMKSKHGVLFKVLPEDTGAEKVAEERKSCRGAEKVEEEKLGDSGGSEGFGLSGNASKTKLETIREGVAL
ncbi:hypothetical protein SUGI_0002500 [Cryptomeria japonica]|nr:hypothetical protein SUGI_0002500 [Cryptomeria japonica]